MGIPERDTAKTIHPICYAGDDGSYLLTSYSSWAEESSWGGGPAGIAIRSAQPVVVHDIRTDPRFALWRDEALKRGIVSTIALPLIAEGEVLGVLGLYRDHPDTFADDEVKLLMEMAGDLAFGIQALRARAAYRQAEDALHEREARLRLITDNSPDAIIMIDEESIIRYANPAAETIFGYPIADLFGQSLTILMPERFRTRHLAAMQEYLATGKRHLPSWKNLEEIGRHRSGREIPLEVSYGEFRWKNACYFIGVLRDITERTEAEAALRESEARYRTIVETANEGIWTLDANAQTVFVNARMAAMLGYTIDEMQGRSLFIFMDDRARQDAEQLWRERLQGMTAQHEFRFTRKDGTDLWTIVSTNPFYDAQGEFAGALGMITDITERKHAEEKLLEREAFLRTVIDTVPNFIGVKDWNSRFILANRALAEAYGTTPEAIIGKSDADFNPDPEEVAWFHRDDQEVIQTRKPKYIPEERVTDSTGHVRWLSTIKVPLIEKDGSCSTLLLATHDITDRKRAEDAVKRERAFLASAIELLPFPILFISPQREIIRQNRASLTLFHEPEQHLWRQIQLQQPQTHAAIPQNEWPLQRALRGEAMPTTEMLMVLPDGRDMPILLQGAPIYVDHEFIAAVVAFQDITALKTADQAKNQFLMVLSHELKTPLTSIIGWAQLAEDAPDLVPEALQTILRNAQEEQVLLERLIILSRILTGRLDLRPQQTDFWEVAMVEVDDAHAHADAHHITFVVHPPSDPLPVDVDTGLLRRAIREILDNALKFTTAGGCITVIGTHEDRRAVLIVQDTGRGFSPEQQRLLMHPFEQLQRLEEYGGIGIGLALAKGILEAHGGQVHITSPGAGQGSLVSLVLPITRDDA